MRKKLQILESDLAKFSALLGFPPFFYAHRRRTSLGACSAPARARAIQIDPGATESSRAEFDMIWPRGVLKRGTERPGGDEEGTPPS